jgi:hypothetical protein
MKWFDARLRLRGFVCSCWRPDCGKQILLCKCERNTIPYGDLGRRSTSRTLHIVFELNKTNIGKPSSTKRLLLDKRNIGAMILVSAGSSGYPRDERSFGTRKIASVVVKQSESKDATVIEIEKAEICAFRSYVSMGAGGTLLHFNLDRTSIQQTIHIASLNFLGLLWIKCYARIAAGTS